jgi:hypothetical protein
MGGAVRPGFFALAGQAHNELSLQGYLAHEELHPPRTLP